MLAGAPEASYAGTPALAGATSILHTAIVAALCLMLPPPWALMVAAWIGILLYALGVAHLGLVYGVSRLQIGLLLCLALLAGTLTTHLLNGLETGLALAGFVWALALASGAKPSRALYVVCGLLPFVRPELAALSVLLMTHQAWRRWKGAGSAAVRDMCVDLAVAIAAALPLIVVVLWNTGTLLPATINAKRFFFAESLLPFAAKTDWLASALTTFSLTFGVLVICVVFLALVPAGRLALLFAALFLAAYFSQFPGALFHNEQRYLALLVPLFLLGTVAGLVQKRNEVRWLAQMLLIVAVIQTVTTLPAHWQVYRHGQRVTNVELASIATFCNLHLPLGSKVLIHDAGYIAYATRFQLIDLVGLKTPWAIGLHKQFTYPTGGKQRAHAINAIAMRSRPDYLIVLAGWDSLFGITEALHSNGWSLLPLRSADQAAEQESGLSKSDCYSVYKLAPPAATR